MKKDINIETLRKAYSRLEKFIEHDKTEQEQAGIVQAFEYCYELSWKIMRKILYNEGLEVNTPKQVFRESVRSGIIKDIKSWIEFANKRNLTVHTYNELVLKDVMKAIPNFKKEVSLLIKEIENRIKE